MESYYYIRDARSDYEFLLKEYNSYSNEKVIWDDDFVYWNSSNDIQLRKICEKCSLKRMVDENDEIKTFTRILRWSHEALLYSNQRDCTEALNATNIIAHCRENKVTVNCRAHAIVLTEALLSLGFKARNVGCLPIDILPYDSHVITAVYSTTLDKWIALDSARNCYFTNRKGELLSIMELRTSLINNEKIIFNYLNRFKKTAAPKSLLLTSLDDEWYLDYLYKNMFRFICSKENRTTNEISPIYYHLYPKNFLGFNYAKKYNSSGIVETIRCTSNENFFWAKPN